ncbi:sulfatase family protein [Pedobacter psychroterrae]|uniref:Arylsulfatase A family protein n=1 Tax=Pedobacter psychroterrae TaxID=2530453 RepID=A0A4R0NU18_9SPHI|nr:sulfatase [Pedobacter psychroterrae]TCD02965.1 arylsulfatase A family protein [Pedobacter psychroterrae]
MIRKLFLLLCVLIALPAYLVQAQEASAKRPNIVIFIADDLGAVDIGPYGNKIVRTPNLDAFAIESMRFTRAFAGSPTCGPSRSTILTGLYPFRHGGHGNHSAVKHGTISIVQQLKPLGYRVAIAGKLHVGPEASFPFERISHSNVIEPGFEKKPGLNYDLNMTVVEEWIAGLKKDEPFVLIVCDHSPHVVWPEKATYTAKEVNIPSKHIDTEDTRKARARYYTDITKMDNNMGRLMNSLKKNGLQENTMVMFTADQGPQWAFAKWSLYDYGIQVPMMVRWPNVVKKGSTADAMVSQVDIVPTLLDITGGKSPVELDGSSFFDVLKGKATSNQVYVYATHTGDNQMNRSPARMVRTKQFKYILNLAPEIEFNTHMNKATDHDGGREYWPSWIDKAKSDTHAKQVLDLYHHRPAEELYDVIADPEEKHSLAADQKYIATLKLLRGKVAAWRKQEGDFETGPEKAADPNVKKPNVPYVFLD